MSSCLKDNQRTIQIISASTVPTEKQSLSSDPLVVQSRSHVQLFATPMDCNTPGFPVLHYLWEMLKLVSIESMMPSNYLNLCLLLLPSIFPSIRVFTNELALHSRQPKYWNFSFSSSPYNLISFRTDWFDLLVFSSTTVRKRQFFGSQPSLWTNSHIRT